MKRAVSCFTVGEYCSINPALCIIQYKAWSFKATRNYKMPPPASPERNLLNVRVNLSNSDRSSNKATLQTQA